MKLRRPSRLAKESLQDYGLTSVDSKVEEGSQVEFTLRVAIGGRSRVKVLRFLYTNRRH